MTGKTTAWALTGFLLINGVCRAQELAAGQEEVGQIEFNHGDCGPAGCGHGHGRGLHRHNDDGRTGCQRIWGWWTYRPLPVPHHLKGCIRFQQTPQAPYYAYFVYLYGPRSPNLGFKPTPVHRGELCAHGLPLASPAPLEGYTDPGTVPAPEETLPTPRHNDAIPDSNTLPHTAPEESEPSASNTSKNVPVREEQGNRR
ncbi:MAG: hypothetical protein FJ271_07545 [Planctomycetes bacterium]|nr:hypothetical protein [Planctomycetota bacterium]